MLALFRHVTGLALKRAAKSWPLAIGLVLYGLAMMLATVPLMRLGIVGGFLLSFVIAACFSSYLTLLADAVAGVPLRFAMLKSSFGARLWDVVSVMFAFWVISLATDVVVRGAGAKGPAIAAIVGITIAFFFNAVPELLYLGRSRSFELLMESGRFVMANPFAWFAPNLLFGLVLLAPSGALLAIRHPGELVLALQGLASPTTVAAVLLEQRLWAVPLLFFLHFVMVFRGILFQELRSGSARMRAFRSQSGR
jgi:hypothetical protein